MAIQNNIARKQSRLSPNPLETIPSNAIFGGKTLPVSNVGDAQANVLQPKRYSPDVNYNQVSSTGGSTNPLNKTLSTATIPQRDAVVAVGQSGAVPQSEVPEVQPHEHGTFFGTAVGLNVTPVRRSGGVDPGSNTAFHPVKSVASIFRPRRHPAHAGERTHAESFSSTHTLLGCATIKGSRWAVIKRSASDAPVAPINPSSASGIPLGNGGQRTSTGLPVTNPPVNSNQHVGGGGFPGGVAPTGQPRTWVNQQSGIQPTEHGTTFPQKLGCKKGCK